MAPTYYVRALRDAGYLVLQCCFSCAMNDWRTTISELMITRRLGTEHPLPERTGRSRRA
jgi:hypothetical protein